MRQSERGFSVPELMVVVTIIGVLTSTAIGNFRDLFASLSRDTAVKQLDYDIRRAKSEALARGARATLTISPDGETYSIGVDELPFSVLTPPVPDYDIFQSSLPSRITVSETDNQLIFDSRGFLIDSGGSPVTGTLLLAQDGSTYATGTVYSTGVFLLRVRP